jgi:hypothetical protein
LVRASSPNYQGSQLNDILRLWQEPYMLDEK